VLKWAGLAALLVAPSAPLAAEQLSIQDFLAVQPAVQTQAWVDPATGNVLVLDAFGKRNAALGLGLPTSVSGSVTIRDVGGGMEEVTVIVHTRDAVCWGFNGAAAPAFGQTPVAVAGGAAPSLGNGFTRAVFTLPAGAPLPSWLQLVLGAVPLQSLTATIMCQDGDLRAGSGFPEGTPGFAQTTQVGLFTTGVPAGCPPEHEADCFPAESISFVPLGN
jgi:hypothetical protein